MSSIREGHAARCFWRAGRLFRTGTWASSDTEAEIYVPPAISTQVMDRGIELGIVIDLFAQQRDVSSQQGMWGVLTRNIFNRQHSFGRGSDRGLCTLLQS